MNTSALAIAIAIVTLGFVLSPAVTEPFMGYTTEQLPFAIANPPIQPAGYAFSIWGIIFGWLVVSAIFGVAARRTDATWHPARRPLFASLFIGMFWLWIAGQSAIWGTISIWLMSVTALWALYKSPPHDRWLLRAPLGLYAGWLTAASFVSLGVTLAGYGLWFGWTTWSLIGLVVAIEWAATHQFKLDNRPEYGIAVIWALIGIIAANASSSVAMVTTAAFGVVVLAILTLRSARQI